MRCAGAEAEAENHQQKRRAAGCGRRLYTPAGMVQCWGLEARAGCRVWGATLVVHIGGLILNRPPPMRDVAAGVVVSQ